MEEAARRDDERIEAALARLPVGLDELASAAALRRELPPELARAAAELAALRRKSATRFPSGWLRWLTRRGLEQASRESVARERARRFAELAPGAAVHDATCGLGADALALSLAGMRVLASDADLATARRARGNLLASPTPHCVFVADAARAPTKACLLMLDPDRRAAAGPSGPERSRDPREWSPAPEAVARRLARARGACLKLPPGFDVERCPSAWVEARPHAWQWVSDGGELCEVNLWTGSLAGEESAAGAREIVALDRRGSIARWRARPDALPALEPAALDELAWIADPDPAVVRSGLLGALGRELGMAPLAPQCAYLGGAGMPRSPFVAAWRVIAGGPADPKAVRRMLTAHDVGPVQVLKRGHPEPSQVLERQFAGRGRQRGVVLVARLEQGHRAFLVERGGVGDEGFEPPTSSL